MKSSVSYSGAAGRPRPALMHDVSAQTRRAWLSAAGMGVFGVAAALAGPRGAALATPASGPSFYDNFAHMQWQDQAGRPVRLHGLRGKVVLFNFIFTACSTVCPVQTHALAQMQGQLPAVLRPRVQLVSVSLDPLSDTPATLSNFARKFQVDHSNWSFITGRPQDVHKLVETLALFRDGKIQGALDDHATALWLVDSKGVLRTRYEGNPPDVARIGRELGALVSLDDPRPARALQSRG